MSTSSQNSNNSGGQSTVSSDTPVTTSTFEGFKRKNIDDPSVFPPLPEIVFHSPLISDEYRILSDDQLKQLNQIALDKTYSLDAGCYLIRFNPGGIFAHFDGTIRVEKVGKNTIASGDLYYHKPLTIWPRSRVNSDPRLDISPRVSENRDNEFPFSGEPNPANGIPVMPRNDYRYYLRITQILESVSTSKSFALGFEMWRFNGVGATPMWSNEGKFIAEMAFATAPAGFPSGADYLTGTVKNHAGSVVGNLTMGWVSEYIRTATIEIDRVSDSEPPLDSGLGHTWQSVFDQVGWKLNIIESSLNVTEVSGDSWSDGEMHAAMLKWRDSADLDSEWRFHILAVNRIDSTERGIMYDAYATDSNNVPREGIGISTHWTIPNSREWGKVKGLRFGLAKAPYFRTALHEIGHAMGLYHNTVDMGIMNTTDVIAANATGSIQFPDNIKWAFASDDQKRLRHMPDIFIRPGGVPFGTSYSVHPLSSDNEPEDAEGLQLSVVPVYDVVPIGAPVRLELNLVNITNERLPAPTSLHMKFGSVKGQVIDPTGNVRTFSPLIICVDELPIDWLEPREEIIDSITLLRGVEGALFSVPGPYTIEVEISWEYGRGHVGIIGQTNVFVTSAIDNDHARAAMQILSTPDTLLSLVLTGDHIEEGNKAIQVALDNPVLRPHYAYIEAKRLAKSCGRREADLEGAAKLIDDNTIMSRKEERKSEKFFS